LRADLPVLFLWGTKDPTVFPALVRKSSKFISRLQDIAIENKGHWVMVEAKDEVTRHIAEWLKGLGYPNIRGRL
jgi:soluble epoxide hydrolase/lipid-phosphate phosphatase